MLFLQESMAVAFIASLWSDLSSSARFETDRRVVRQMDGLSSTLSIEMWTQWVSSRSSKKAFWDE